MAIGLSLSLLDYSSNPLLFLQLKSQYVTDQLIKQLKRKTHRHGISSAYISTLKPPANYEFSRALQKVVFEALFTLFKNDS